jgi:signal transduction histidine kinase/ligand-binding sensor domain-containing protein
MNPDRSLPELQHTAWSVKDGAPADIWALAQSADGFLWLGTGSGLYRFDGVVFEHIAPPGAPNIGFRDVTALLPLPSGELWIGYYAGGASRMKGGQLTDYGEREGVPPGWVTAFAREDDGTIWLAAREGLARFSGGHWERIGDNWNFHGNAANWILLDRQGTLWVAGGDTVAYLRKGAHTFEDTGVKSDYKSTLAQAPDGTVWFASETLSPRPLPRVAQTTRSTATTIGQATGSTATTIGQATGITATTIGQATGITATTIGQATGITTTAIGQATGTSTTAVGLKDLPPVKRLLLDRDGSVWASDAAQGGIYRATLNAAAAPTARTTEKFGEAQGLTSDLAVPLIEDHEGNIWVGTNMGLNRFRETNFVAERRVPLSRTGYSIARGDGSAVWIASGTALYRSEGGHVEQAATSPTSFHSAYRAPDGVIWLGRRDDLLQIKDGHMTTVRLPEVALADDYAYVIAMTSDGVAGLWVSVVDRGLMHFDGTSWMPTLDLPGLSATAAVSAWTDARSRHWFGYSNGSVIMLDAQGAHDYTSREGLQIGPIIGIGGAADDILVGGEFGLARFDGSGFRSLTTARAEPFTGISGIVITPTHDVWLNGNRGVIRMTEGDLQRALDNPQSPLRYELFDRHDGLPGIAQQGEDSTAMATDDGRLWFLTNHGVAWIDPAHLIRNTVPPAVVIRSLSANGRRYPTSGTVTLPEKTRTVLIDYTALSLGAPERVKFRYKLEGADDSWRDAGNERHVIYANLHARQYRFRVVAANEAGVWNETGAQLTFDIPAAYYEKLWFLVLCAVAAVLLLLALYVARMAQVTAQVRARLLERVFERERIARELHDTFLQSVNALMMRFQAAAQRIPQHEPARALMEQSLDRAAAVLAEGRRRVQDLRSANPIEHDLPQRLTNAVEELVQGHEADSRIEIEGTPRDLHPVVRDEAYRIAREALANASKHAEATRIDIKLTYGRRQFVLRVVDDGRGMDQNESESGVRTDHFGITGMRERAAKIMGTLKLTSSLGAGTVVQLAVPGRFAYSTARPTGLSRARYRWWRAWLDTE